jgi:hypothetical protein
MSDVCFEGWSKENGNLGGRCCCNCKYQRPIAGHPWNKRELTKKSISTIIGYACTVPDMDNIIMFDGPHGMCEMHTEKNNVVQLKRVK